MAESPLTCPYCNALVPAAALLGSGRPSCPRCGDRLPATLTNGAPGLNSPPPPAETLAPSPGAKRRTVLVILGLVTIITVIGLGYVWYTVDSPRKNDPPPPDHPAPELPSAALSALGYVPRDTNLVAALQLTSLRTAGKSLDLLLPGPLDEAAKTFERVTGLKVDLIDHVVLATTWQGDWPQLTVVVHTTLPYPAEIIARANQPHQPMLWQQKPVYRFKLAPLGEGLLWLIDQQTLIVVARADAVKMEDLAGIPCPPLAGLEALAAPLRDLVPKHHQPVFWIAGHLEKPEAALLALTPVPKDMVALLTSVQSFGVALQWQQELFLTGDFHCHDLVSAKRLAQFLEDCKPPQAKSFRVTGPQPGQEQDRWVTLQVRLDRNGLRQLLEAAQGWLAPAAKK